MTEVRATIWDEATGDVVGTMRANAATVLLNQQPGLGVWLGDELDASEWRFEGRRPVRRPEADVAAKRLTAARAAALARLPAVLDAAAAPLVSKYPLVEMLGWAQLETEASEALRGGPVGDMLLASMEGSTRSQTKVERASVILSNAEKFKRAHGEIGRRRRIAEVAIENATTAEEVYAALDAAGTPLLIEEALSQER